MTTSALMMMTFAWGIIIFFTGKFLIKALRTKRNSE